MVRAVALPRGSKRSGEDVLPAASSRTAQDAILALQRGVGNAVVARMLVTLGNTAQERINTERLRDSNPLEYRDGQVSGLAPGEVLHLLAHSGDDIFSTYTAATLFQWLRRNGLQPTLGGIQLHGCESAGFARDLQELVNTPSPGWTPPVKPIEVLGVAGYHFVSPEGTSYGVGSEKGNDVLWTQLRFMLATGPSDEAIEDRASQLKDRGTLVKIQAVRSSAAAVQAMRATVKQQLLQAVAQIAHRGALDALEREDIRRLARRVNAFAQLTGGAEPDLASARAEAGAIAAAAIQAGVSIIDEILPVVASKELDARQAASVAKLRNARTELSAALPTLPESLTAAFMDEGPMDMAWREMEELETPSRSEPRDDTEAEQSGDEAEPREEADGEPAEAASPAEPAAPPGFADRFSTHLDRLRDAEVHLIKEPLRLTLLSLHFDEEDVPAPSLPPAADADVQPPSTPPPTAGLDVPPPATAPPPPPPSVQPPTAGLDVPPPATAPPPPPPSVQPPLDALDEMQAALQAQLDELLAFGK